MRQILLLVALRSIDLVDELHLHHVLAPGQNWASHGISSNLRATSRAEALGPGIHAHQVCCLLEHNRFFCCALVGLHSSSWSLQGLRRRFLLLLLLYKLSRVQLRHLMALVRILHHCVVLGNVNHLSKMPSDRIVITRRWEEERIEIHGTSPFVINELGERFRIIL